MFNVVVNEAAEQAKKNKLERLRRELGKEICEELANPSVIEIMLNPDTTLWVDCFERGLVQIGNMNAVSSESAMRSIASFLGKDLTAENPILECELPLDGSRFAGSLPPIVKNPIFTIRKRASVIFTLDNYVAQGSLSEERAKVLKEAVKQRKNILVVGGTQSGKTTFTNALLDHVAKCAGNDQRVVIIEDTPELQCAAPNKVEMLTTTNINMIDLLKHTLRLRPDRIVVGEVRGKEALALLKAWNTGHPGGAGTIHANNALAGLTRLGQLIQEANVPENPELIAEAVNYVVVIKKTNQGRKIDQLVRIDGFDKNKGYLYKEF